MAFGEGNAKYLMSLRKGSLVYVEAAYEIKEPDRDADPSTPQGQRQVFLRHGTLIFFFLDLALDWLVRFFFFIDRIKVIQNPRDPEHTEDAE